MKAEIWGQIFRSYWQAKTKLSPKFPFNPALTVLKAMNIIIIDYATH